MAEENNTPHEANEQAAPQEVHAQPTANNAEDFLSNFNWHNYEEGIDVIEDAQLLQPGMKKTREGEVKINY